MQKENIEIGKLYDLLLSEGFKIENNGKYELIKCPDIEVLTYGNKYTKINCISRHKTSKHLIRITVSSMCNMVNVNNRAESVTDEHYVTVTTDHICMVYNKDHFFENIDAKNLRIGDFVSIYDNVEQKELIGEILKIDDIGTTEEYVYDLEVDDKMHAFYANDILIHNSIFLNLDAITSQMKKERNLPESILDWKQKDRNDLWKTMSKFVDEDVNDFVHQLAHDFCHTSLQDILKYELEYMSACGIYEGKKHYATLKIFDEGDPVKKIKYSGIELKKASLPKFVKKYLLECYEGVLLTGWKESDYQNYMNNLYDKFKSFSILDISFWKGYNTARDASGFLQMAQIKAADGHTIGTTGIAKAATYYNLIINKMGLGTKYELLRLGDKARFLYISPDNPYKIDVMAYKDGQWPDEFNQLFKPDYRKMFDKLVLDPLKRYREACGFSNIDPSKQVVFDIFEL